MASTRSQATTRSSSSKGSLPAITNLEDSSPAMEIDNDNVISSQQSTEENIRPCNILNSEHSSGSVDNPQSVIVTTSTLTNNQNPPTISKISDTTNLDTMAEAACSFPGNLLNADAASSAMDVDPPPEENEDSSSTSSSSDSSDSSDSDSDSETDEETSEKNGIENHNDMHDLEKLFTYGRELFYKERLYAVDEKLEEVRSGRAKEYLGPLEKLQENMSIRIEITAKLRDLRLRNLHNVFDAEELACHQNFHSEKQLLHDAIKDDLEDKIRRLEVDRNNDFTSELLIESVLKRKNKKSVDVFGEKKKKPVVVSGPYIVYMIEEVDIYEDWTAIKKLLAQPKRKFVDPPSTGVF